MILRYIIFVGVIIAFIIIVIGLISETLHNVKTVNRKTKKKTTNTTVNDQLKNQFNKKTNSKAKKHKYTK